MDLRTFTNQTSRAGIITWMGSGVIIDTTEPDLRVDEPGSAPIGL